MHVGPWRFRKIADVTVKRNMIKLPSSTQHPLDQFNVIPRASRVGPDSSISNQRSSGTAATDCNITKRLYVYSRCAIDCACWEKLHIGHPTSQASTLVPRVSETFTSPSTPCHVTKNIP